MNHDNGGLSFSETSVADYRLNIEAGGGNVGTGTGKKQEKLHVAGNARIDGTIYTNAFEDNSINKVDFVDEAGIVSAGASDVVTLGTTWSVCLTREITVPTAGYILIFGLTKMALDHSAVGSTAVSIVFSDLPNDANGGRVWGTYLALDAGAGRFIFTVSAQHLLCVPAKGTYTFYLLAQSRPRQFGTYLDSADGPALHSDSVCLEQRRAGLGPAW